MSDEYRLGRWTELSLKRRQFFQRFNFKIEYKGKGDHDKISSKIGDLKIFKNS